MRYAYKFCIRDWDFGTAHLSLEEEAAFLRVCNEFARIRDGVPDEKQTLNYLFRSGTRKSRSLRDQLVEKGFLDAGDGRLWPSNDEWRGRLLDIKPVKRNPLPQQVRNYVFERDDFTCVYCGSTDGPFEVDHIKPVARGGTDCLENLCCACRDCNRSKSDKTIDEWEGAE